VKSTQKGGQVLSSEKDPAVLFYPESYIVGTRFMTYEQKGKYMDLLCFQHQQGHLSEEDMLAICGEYDARIFSKFEIDDEGKYFNRRMEIEKEKRQRYTSAMKANGEKGGRPKQNQSDNQQVNQSVSQSDNQSGNLLRNRNININTNVIKDIIDYLNKVLGTKYKSNAEYINKHINARLNEGFTYEDFVTVIDKKYAEWSGTDMAKYLRPETLFGTKFQAYLNELEGGKNDGVKEPYVQTTQYGTYY
jgi:uncharacterized phage protein (TIGR02220 family)